MRALGRGMPILREGYKTARIEIARFQPANAENGPSQILLLANAEFLDYVLVALGIVSLEVVQQAATLADHHQETAAGGVILLVRLEMIRQIADPFAEHRDLNFRAPRIAIVGSEPGYDVLFALSS
jgi:hypothetical protein